MRVMIWTAAIAALCASATFAAEQTLSGTISDSMCGVSHKGMSTKMTDRECTQVCASKGAQYALVSDGKAYKLMNHDSDLKTHAGHTVNLTGDVKGDTIRVSKIVMPRSDKN
jgi:hypothetical protein